MTDRKTLDQMTSDDLDELHDQLAALRAVSRGYCPACGRGDAAPTLDDWENERRRAEQLAGVLREVLAVFTTTACDEPGGRVLGYLAEAPVHPDDMARWRAALNPKETTMPTCTATIEGPHTGSDKPVRCVLPVHGDDQQHESAPAGPNKLRLHWTDHHAGATPHQASSEEATGA